MSYYVAQICQNGHIITDTYNSSGKKKGEHFCRKCGEKTITKCPECNTNIRGRWVTSWQSTGEFRRLVCTPKFCHHCGVSYPWTIRNEDAAKELISTLTELSEKDRQQLSDDLPDLISESPRTEVVANKFRLTIGKLSGMMKDLLYNLTVDIASETAKKIIKDE